MIETTDQHVWLSGFDTDSSIFSLTDGLINGTWPISDWKHREHCIATAGLLLFRTELNLEQQLPGIIQRYNLAQGGRNTDTEGYHHTITLLYLKAIKDFISKAPTENGAVAICREILQSPIGKKDYPLRYYSRELLFSVAARKDWREPDIERPDYL